MIYKYHASGQPAKISANGTETLMEYDEYGYQKTLSDPNAGVTSYKYNAFGELIEQTDANGNKFEMTYDVGGRLLSKTNNENPEFNLDYQYYPAGTSKGLLEKVIMNNGVTQSFVYDDYRRTIEKEKDVFGTVFEMNYQYDDYGNIESMTYPSDFEIINHYDENGFLTAVYKSNNEIVWEAGADPVNEMGQFTNYNLGENNIPVTYNYDDKFNLENIKYGQVFDYDYHFEIETGNLEYRKDNLNELKESFSYDDANRLESWVIEDLNNPDNVYDPVIMDYKDNGNIRIKSDIGPYDPDAPQEDMYMYDDNKPHAVKNINVFDEEFNEQIINYNALLKPAEINEGENRLKLKYGPYDELVKSGLYQNNTLIKTKFYNGLYEKEINGQNTKEFYFIPAPAGLAAVTIINNNNPQDADTYFFVKDHLNSVMALMDKDENVVQQNAYDPWGNFRNPADWTPVTMSEVDLSVINRGFTGHLTLPEFGLINMGARLYDPLIARVLSPDNFVQDPTNPQNYNRYSYCLNNPLKYTDPDGEWVHLVIGAAIGGTANLLFNLDNIDDFWEGLSYFGIGAAAGALGAGVGAGIGVAYTGGSFGAGFIGTGSVTTSSLGVAGGVASGFGGGFSSGLISGTGNSLMAGNNFGQSLGAGFNEGLKQGLIGGGIGGVIGGISAYSAGNHPFTGKPPYYEASLEDFSLVYQDDPMNCKNATLESIEKMNGGTRTQANFKRLGDAFLKENPNATIEEYFEHFGYKIQNPKDWTYKQIGRGMQLGNPTVINENIGGGHTLIITKIRQWASTSNVKVWFGDPARGMWKANWNILGNSSFNNGAYLFWLR